MKKLLRILALALCLALALSLLAGCGQSNTDARTDPADTQEDAAPADATPADTAQPSGSETAQRPQRAGSLVAPSTPLTGPIELPELFTDGMYRRVANADQMKGEGRLVYSSGELSVWSVGASAATTVNLDITGADEPLHYLFESIGANSSITAASGKVTAIILRPPTFGTTERNCSLLTPEFLANVRVTVACNAVQSPDGGAVTPTDTTIILLQDLQDLYLDLRGSSVDADSGNSASIRLDGDGKLDLTSARAGDSAKFGTTDEEGVTRTFTITVNDDGTATFFYATPDSIN